eukprot:7851890-Pyramimonas_sp.AAC.1
MCPRPRGSARAWWQCWIGRGLPRQRSDNLRRSFARCSARWPPLRRRPPTRAPNLLSVYPDLLSRRDLGIPRTLNQEPLQSRPA